MPGRPSGRSPGPDPRRRRGCGSCGGRPCRAIPCAPWQARQTSPDRPYPYPTGGRAPADSSKPRCADIEAMSGVALDLRGVDSVEGGTDGVTRTEVSGDEAVLALKAERFDLSLPPETRFPAGDEHP